MKNLFLSLITTFTLLAFTGCNDNAATEGMATQKSEKCGAGKCGDAKKDTKAVKCGDAKTQEKSAKCGAGKCGDGK